MIHSFDVDIAAKYGIECAILLNNIYYWCLKNEANGKHLHNGKYWVYNTKKAFSKLFPYMTERQIDYALTKLKKENLIMTGNFNYSKMNRTIWYTITDFAKCILQNCKMENTNLCIANDKIVGCIDNTNILNNSNTFNTTIHTTNIKSTLNKSAFYSGER